METRKTQPSADPTMRQFVAASIEEIRFAEELRRQIERRYLGQTADVRAASPAVRID
jgi:hypothetical protein